MVEWGRYARKGKRWDEWRKMRERAERTAKSVGKFVAFTFASSYVGFQS